MRTLCLIGAVGTILVSILIGALAVSVTALPEAISPLHYQLEEYDNWGRFDPATGMYSSSLKETLAGAKNISVIPEIHGGLAKNPAVQVLQNGQSQFSVTLLVSPKTTLYLTLSISGTSEVAGFSVPFSTKQQFPALAPLPTPKSTITPRLQLAEIHITFLYPPVAPQGLALREDEDGFCRNTLTPTIQPGLEPLYRLVWSASAEQATIEGKQISLTISPGKLAFLNLRATPPDKYSPEGEWGFSILCL